MNVLLVGGGLVIVGIVLKFLKNYFAPPANPIGSYVSDEELIAVNRKAWRQGATHD